MILPNNGRGYSIEGAKFDHLVAGSRISRRLSIVGGRAIARSEFRRVEREVSAASARESADLIETISNDAAFLRGPTSAAAPARRPPPVVVPINSATPRNKS